MKKMFIQKSLSVLLAIVIILLSFPVIAIAQNENTNVQEQTAVAPSYDEDIYIIQEDTAKRNTFEKHYLCSNGTYVVATYAEAIHYQDEYGNWQDIDMSFETITTPSATTYTAQSQDFALAVPSVATSGHLMHMENNDFSFAWTLTAQKAPSLDDSLSADATASLVSKPTNNLQVSTQATPQVATATPTHQEQSLKLVDDEDAFALPNIASKVTYNHLFGEDAGVSVVYTTYQNKVEEDIYIQKPTDITAFSMVVDAPQLTPYVNSDNSVDFLDHNHEMQYHVGVPYMEDANHAVTHDIETSVSLVDGQWVITYTPDADWFTADERIYPILLDPSITTNEYVSNIQDTYVVSGTIANRTTQQVLYLHDNNYTNKAIIRVVNMPQIDASLPILNATFSCYASQSPMMDGMIAYLQMDYTETNTSVSLDYYTYSQAESAQDLALYSANTYLSYGLTKATFNLKPYIHQILEGGGDFIVGYTPNTTPQFIGGIISSEYTDTSYHPTMTVTYGYAVPENITAGGTYLFKNYASWKFMIVPEINAPLGMNVYQVDHTNTSMSGYNQFQLLYNAQNGSYKLHPLFSYLDTSKVIEAATPTNPTDAQNVCVGNSTTSGEQEWLFIPASDHTYYIVLKSNMNMCLTAYGDANGTKSGTSPTSPGNIFVQPLSHDNNYQKWMICDTSGEEIPPEDPSSVINGEYHLINKQSGRFLYRYQSSTLSSRGVLTETQSQDTVKMSQKVNENDPYTIYKSFVSWRITNLQNGYCTIQIMDDTNIYHLYADTTNHVAKIGNMTEDIPDRYQWKVSVASGGMRIQNKLGYQEDENGHDILKTCYLTDIGEITLDQSTIALEAYDVSDAGQVWRLHGIETYKELDTDTFVNLQVETGQTKTPIIDNTQNYSCNGIYDFIYECSSSYQVTNITIDNVNCTITGNIPEPTFVHAKHKTTGRKYGFNVVITLPTSGSEIPYNPALWNNSTIQPYSNCYNYALNKMCNSSTSEYYKLQPGSLSETPCLQLSYLKQYDGYPLYYMEVISAAAVENAANADAESQNFTFTPIGRYDECPEGTYKVALVVDCDDNPNINYLPKFDEELYDGCYILDSDTDYHWYRQNPDGTWSHKSGGGIATNLDASNEIIYDPLLCNKNYENISGMNYEIFVGYFAVTPLN